MANGHACVGVEQNDPKRLAVLFYGFGGGGGCGGCTAKTARATKNGLKGESVMSWYDLLRDVVGGTFNWVRDRQDAAIIYYLLKYDGSVERTAAKLGAPQARVLRCRDQLKSVGYLRTMISFSRPGWRRTPAGDALFRALQDDTSDSE